MRASRWPAQTATARSEFQDALLQTRADLGNASRLKSNTYAVDVGQVLQRASKRSVFDVRLVGHAKSSRGPRDGCQLTCTPTNGSRVGFDGLADLCRQLGVEVVFELGHSP